MVFPARRNPATNRAREPQRVERSLPRPEQPGRGRAGGVSPLSAIGRGVWDRGLTPPARRGRPRAPMVQEGGFTLLSSTRQTRAKPLIHFEEFSRFFGIAPKLELGIEPGASVSPEALGGCQRDSEHLGDFGHGEAGEEAELDQLGLRRFGFRQSKVAAEVGTLL
jgi:hypothetical protein